MIKSFQAFILHKQWLGDTRLRGSFFTCEMGLISCFCRSSAKQKKTVLLQAFTPLWLAVTERHDKLYAQRIENKDNPFELKGHALFSALYMNELLYYSLSPNHPEPELFELYLLTLNALACIQDKQDIEPLLRRFEWALLKVSGYSFSMTEEAGGSILIHPTAHYRFVAGEGFILASQGFLGAHILALAADDFSTAAHRQAAKKIMRQAIDHLVGGREIKSRALYISTVLVKPQ